MKIKNGFTLIEVIFVLGVLSILLLLSTPIKVSILDNQKEKQFLTTFENDILYMQSLSYLSEEYFGLKIKSDSYTLV
ncbi:prepilin-type N-terminal cleavage/methylation domain-containing protein [Virgibacillus necropolis]|uniref:prepilin-type N-terminal cleavage/methylation domain-containing protein n=1 Tax=Virgibacillus necropolis TaxID=163877 RepID=UPI00384AD5B3